MSCCINTNYDLLWHNLHLFDIPMFVFIPGGHLEENETVRREKWQSPGFIMYCKCYLVSGLIFHYKNNVYRQVPVRQMLFITFTIQSVVFKKNPQYLHFIILINQKKKTDYSNITRKRLKLVFLADILKITLSK